MSTVPFESDNSRDLQAKLPGRNPIHALIPVWLCEVRDVVHRSLVATNTILMTSASRRVNEGLAFSKKLAACTSTGSILDTHVSYCGTMFERYQAAFAQLQVIPLDLASEVLRTAPLTVRATPSFRAQQPAHSRNAA